MIVLFEAALACGGLFCATTPQQPLPVVQNAERIAFGIDRGFVETHVQIFYEGPPDAFAWVVPVKGDVEVFVSNEALFQQLDAQLAPRFNVRTRVVGDCGPVVQIGCRSESSLPSEGFSPDVPADPGVTVGSEGQVGPYDYVTLTADSEDAIVNYLVGEGFQVDPSMEEAIRPYVAADSYFLAVRLQKDRQVGDIAPLGFRVPGNEASVPIQLTRVAAVEDMGLQVNVFGDSVAVSSNYLHAHLDEANFDWNAGTVGADYYDWVARAVDEAGGHAVVTDAAVETDDLNGRLWSEGSEQLATQLATLNSAAGFVNTLNTLAPPDNATLTYGLEGFVEHERGQPLVSTDFEGLDLAAVAAQLDDRVFASLRRAQELMDLPYVTRLSTTLDPAEMTLDPMFVLQPDAPEVPVTRSATVFLHCEGTRSNPRRELELEDGRTYHKGPISDSRDRTEAAVIRIERWSSDGVEVVTDHTEAAFDASDRPIRACGCAGRPSLPGLLLVLIGALTIRRRFTR